MILLAKWLLKWRQLKTINNYKIYEKRTLTILISLIFLFLACKKDDESDKNNSELKAEIPNQPEFIPDKEDNSKTPESSNNKNSEEESEEESNNKENLKSLKNQLLKMVQEGKLPKLDQSDSLLGIDANKNGVRDDVELWIATKFPRQIPEAIQYAKTHQEILDIDITDKNALEELSLKQDKAINCIFVKHEEHETEKYHPLIIFKELRKITFNTKQRLKKYLEHNEVRNGTHGTTAEGDTCDK